MSKNIFIIIAAVFIIIFITKNIFSDLAADTQELRQRTLVAEQALVEATSLTNIISDKYSLIVDSLTARSDSLNAVAEASRVNARKADRLYKERASLLVDSLRESGEEKFAEQIIALELVHDSVVTAMSSEIDALMQDRELLWKRIDLSDSLITAQAAQIHASNTVMLALMDERDAWKAKAMPTLPKRLFQSLPAVLTTAVIVSAIR
jgi:hypothetical protein